VKVGGLPGHMVVAVVVRCERLSGALLAHDVTLLVLLEISLIIIIRTFGWVLRSKNSFKVVSSEVTLEVATKMALDLRPEVVLPCGQVGNH